MQKITVVSLGHGGVEQVTLGAWEALKNASLIILRTSMHPVATALIEQGLAFEALDAFYELATDFDALNEQVVIHLLEKANQSDIVYAVANASTDETVSALLAKAGGNVTVIPGVGVLEDAFSKTHLPSQAARYVTAMDLPNAILNPRELLLVTELNSAQLAGSVKLHLLSLYDDDMQVYFIHERQSKLIPLFELDRQRQYNHTSSVLVPSAAMTKRKRFNFNDLVEVLAVLRGENGCPWDKEQTHESLREYLIEEAYETVAAINQQDNEHVYDELGDVMLQVVFHATIAKEHGTFDIDDVTTAIVHKMMSRHRHIFGTDQCDTAEDVLTNWEKIKKEEKGIKSYTGLMQDIPASLPSLMRASKVQNKAKQVGFDFSDAKAALQKVYEEAQELEMAIDKALNIDEEMGDLLFSCVNVARKLKIQPELALQAAVEKFIKRFSNMEKQIILEGKALEGLTLLEMDVYWEKEKRATQAADSIRK